MSRLAVERGPQPPPPVRRAAVSTLPPGQAFLFDDGVFVRLGPGGVWRAENLLYGQQAHVPCLQCSTGQLYTFSAGCSVEPVESTLTWRPNT